MTVMFFSSCAVRSLYIPVSQNVPLFDSGREVKASVYLSTNHIEVQAAHNPVNHVAVATNINFGSGIAIYDIAAGIYDYNRKQNLRYELFGGYGYNSNITFPDASPAFFTKENINYEINSLYHKYYLQPALGYFGKIKMYKLNYSFSLSARFSYLRFRRFLYREIDIEKTTDPDNPYYLVNRSYTDKGLFLFEPCFTNKVGLKNIYGIIQIQAMIPHSQQIDVRNTKFSPGLLFSLGIQYNLHLKGKKNAK